MKKRLPFHTFLDEFLIACAASVDKKTDTLIDAAFAAHYINAPFDESWPDSAMKVLCNNGLLRGSYTLGQPVLYQLTGEGLLRAEMLAAERGKDLDDLIEAQARPVTRRRATGDILPFPNLRQLDSPVLSVREDGLPATLTLGSLLALRGAAKAVSRDVKAVVAAIQTQRLLPEADQPEWSEYLPRIEMGRNLLKAAQAYEGMLHFCLLSPLQWVLPRVTQDAAREEVERLVAATERLCEA
ncbi:hypothetical protein [Sinorhizobium sp. RAC02]|uniref:hypothetical protein n=1 Tax=Sinorhizobium sp. RAC02 TaxID=1842534 RepID=UPI00083E3464|nr:hypothetical protein [Sinorhizobium sp. RAC02]AOF89460.1 hypothetical protein BSY16_2015 [Sinorhizobium sp. RAC02]